LIYLKHRAIYKLLRLLILVFFLLTAKMLHAQPYYFKHYQVENGLSNNTVFCSVQDHNSFMWFGTKDGLNRFDGYSFKTYRHDVSNPQSLGSDKIHSLLSDNKVGIWVGTDRGLYRYDPVKEAFNSITLTSGMTISVLQMDHKGLIWILSGGKIYQYNPIKNSLATVQMEASFSPTHLFCRPNGEMIITSPDAQIAVYNLTARAFETRYLLDKIHPSSIGWISAISETKDGQLLIGTTNQGLKLFNLKTHTLKDLATLNTDKTHIYVRDIKASANEEFWIGTESGLYIYHHKDGNITHLQKQVGNPYALSDNAIYTLCADREGGIWTGTYFGGVNYYSPFASVFTKYFPGLQKNAISGSAIREICKDKNGNFWIGTEDAGLNKLDPRTGLFTSYFPNGQKYSIAHSNVHALLPNGNQLWIGTFEHGLDIMNINTGLITKHYHAGRGNSLRSNFILCLYKTREGIILVATTSGLYSYNAKSDDFDLVPGLPVSFYNNIIQDSEGSIWAGTYNSGLFNFKLGDGTFRNFISKDNDKTSLRNNTVNGIFEDSRKNIWVATDGGGLALFNKKTSTFKSFTVIDGFPSNFPFRMQEDSSHNLWISSTAGILRFNPETKVVKAYTREDGLLTDQFNYNSSFKDTDGRLYFGSVKGMISFLPEQLNTTTATAQVFLTGFQIDNTENQRQLTKSVSGKSMLYTKEITLQHNQSSFSIDFAALSYIAPEMTEYAYKMKGLYNNWEYLKTNRKVYFTKLAPGKYVFEAKSMISGSKLWSTNNVQLHITILPPFWKTPQAYLLYAIVIIGLVSVLVWEYHKRTESRNKRRMEIFEHKKEKEIYQAKIEFFTNVAHEIRTPLTLIKGPMEKLLKLSREVHSDPIEKNLRIMDRNTERLLNLTNQLLDFRKTEISGFSLNFVKANISDLLRDVNLQFQFAAEQKRLHYAMILPEKDLFAYIDLEAFYKIMSNLIDNAIKYGKSIVEIKLFVQEQNDEFTILVKNDGSKIAADLKDKIFEPFFRAKETEMKQGTGIGLSISKSLTELHKGELSLTENEGDYNIFAARFPIHQTMEFNLEGKWKKK
jgi:signal transduction histidine kinase/ligand-binding sensor domain-containing protein